MGQLTGLRRYKVHNMCTIEKHGIFKVGKEEVLIELGTSSGTLTLLVL